MERFSDKYIQRMINDIGVYNRGIRLVEQIDSFQYFEKNRVISAVVYGTYPYTVEIELDEDDDVESYSCECKAFSSIFGACKHVVAVMLYANDYFDKKYDKATFIEEHNTFMQGSVNLSEKDVFLPISELGIDFRRKTRKVNLWLEQSIVLGTPHKPSYMQIECKIGEQRPYKVKDFYSLFEAMDKNKSLYFGKSFTFRPDTMYFSGIEKEVLEFLKNLLYKERIEREFRDPYGYFSDRGYQSVKANTIILIEDNMKKYFDIVKDSGIPINISGHIGGQCKIYKDFEINMGIKEVDGLLVLEADYSKDIKIMALTKDFQLVLDPYTKSLYRVPEEKAKLLERIHKIRLQKKNPVFLVGKKEQEQFIRNFLKPNKDKLKVQVDKSLEEKMTQKELVAKIYFDVLKNGISANLEYSYGERVLNPLSDESQQTYVFYMRDFEKEEMILDLIKSLGMYENNGKLILDDEEKIVELIEGRIEELKQLAEVYYSEDFKKIQVRQIKKIRMGVRLNSETNLLEFDFDIDDFDDSELNKLFHNLKEKKKYYRLKDGSLLKIDNAQLANASRLISDLSLDTRKFKSGILDIPANRALFVDNFLNERKMTDFVQNDGFKKLVEDITHPQDMEFHLDEGISEVLRPYQRFGYKWLKTLSHYGFGGILADDMGLGKTLQVLVFIDEERKKDKRPCLVVAPTSLIYNWKAESDKFMPSLKVSVIHGTKAERKLLLESSKESDIIVTSYGSLKRDIARYQKIDFSYIFVDEAQHIKNPNTLNANSVKSIKAKGYFAMTGTPIENSLTELWSIFDFIMPGYLMSHNSFVNKFEKPIVHKNDMEKLNLLSRFIRPFVLRRLKREVLQELPEKIESKVIADMTKEQRKIYAAYLKQAQGEIANEIKERGFDRSKIKILALLTRLRQICCHPAMFVENYKGGSGKLETLLEIIEASIASGHRLLLFSQFTSMLEIIGKALKESGKSYFYLDGSTKAKDRIDMVNRFNNGEREMFLISLKAGGTGLNLTGADMVIHYDPWWNPAVEDQATDRAYRIGQTKAVQVFKIITKGTIEEKIFELQEKKRGLINNVIQPGENLLTKLREEEIRELFQI
jgi:SNF2 family DNA or RNA helicase